MRTPKIFIHWWEDSSGRRTCHENKFGSSYEQSFLGEVRCFSEVWKVKLKDKDWQGEYKNMYEAMKALQKLVNGRQVENWDDK